MTFQRVGEWSLVFRSQHIANGTKQHAYVPVPVFNFQVNFTERGKLKATSKKTQANSLKQRKETKKQRKNKNDIPQAF